MSTLAVTDRRFVVATPGRSVCDENARVLHRHQLLRFIALGTRRGTNGVPAELTRLNPAVGLAAFAATRVFSTTTAESFRFRLHPWFDRWVRRQLHAGNHVISSYGYVNGCFQWARAHGGKTFLDGGNSHPENYWNILSEEHRRWNISAPPIVRHQAARARAMMEHVDFVLSPSSFVSRTFLERGFKPEQILRNIYPVDLCRFAPKKEKRDKNKPLTIISTGGLSLRKGAPYLLESFRLIHERHPTARFLLTRAIHDNVIAILAKYRDLPVDWSPVLPHAELAERLRGSDLFVLPSLEEGLVRSALEAMACGLPVILTPNTGSADYIKPGISGEIVPIRDPIALADAIMKWAEIILSGAERPEISLDENIFSHEVFEKEFIGQLRSLGLA